MVQQLLERFEILVASAGSARLPSIRALAALWQVSPRTAHAVIKEAAARGWVETRLGGGIWVKGKLPQRVASGSRRFADTLAEEMREALRSGKWAGGEKLPSPKDLAARYRVHAKTLRKALGLLEDEHLLERNGQAWRVSRPRHTTSARPVLLCLGVVDASGHLRVDSDREWEFWREIQAEATRNGLRAEVRPLDGWMTSGVLSRSKPVGAVVSTWHIPDPMPLLKSLHRARLASAVWLENPLLMSGRLPFTSPWLGYHDLAYSGESGALLARHSVLARHRRLAWISPFHGAEWSRNRLAGLRANLPRGTEVHEALGPWVSEWDILPLGDHGRAPAGRRPIFKRFERVLQQALESRSSLWVAASDAVALHCLEWLAGRGITVPSHLALAGFDDTREALRHGLTSVRFDVEAMARAMVRQVLMPGASRQRLTRYEGMVIVRASTP